MYDKAIKGNPSSLFIADWFVTQQQLDAWFDGHYWYHDDDITDWFEDYKKRKAQKAKIQEKLLPIA